MLESRIMIVLSVFLLVALWSADSALSREAELVARWPLDETSGEVVHDVIGGNDGAFVGGTLEWVPAKFENGLRFDGTEERSVEIPKNPELEFPTSVTLIAWVNVDTASIVGERGELVSCANGYFIRTQAGAFRAFIQQPGDWPCVVGQTNVEADRWYFVAMTYDGQDIKLYVDGEFDGSLAVPGEISYVDSKGRDLPLRFGAHAGGTGYWFTGILDEVEIWDRAMTQEQIMAVYESPPLSRAVSPKGGLTTTWGKLKFQQRSL